MTREIDLKIEAEEVAKVAYPAWLYDFNSEASMGDFLPVAKEMFRFATEMGDYDPTKVLLAWERELQGRDAQQETIDGFLDHMQTLRRKFAMLSETKSKWAPIAKHTFGYFFFHNLGFAPHTIKL